MAASADRLLVLTRDGAAEAILTVYRLADMTRVSSAVVPGPGTRAHSYIAGLIAPITAARNP